MCNEQCEISVLVGKTIKQLPLGLVAVVKLHDKQGYYDE